MNSVNPAPSPEQILKILRILWGSFLFFQFMLGFMTLNIQPLPDGTIDFAAMNSGLQNPTVMMAGLIALICIGCGFALPALLKNAIFPATVLKLALFEACGLAGFVTALTTQNTMVVFPFLFLSIVSFLISFPKSQ